MTRDRHRGGEILCRENKAATQEARAPNNPAPNPVLEEIRLRRIAQGEIPDLPRGPQPDGSYVALDGSVLPPLHKPPSQTGPLPACTPATAGFIIDEVAKGRPLTIAAAIAGRHPMTVLDWIKRGKDGTEPYASFATAVARARAAWAAWISDRIAVHIERDWAAGSFLLERTLPEIYGRKDSADSALTQAQAAVISPILVAIFGRNKQQPDALPDPAAGPARDPTMTPAYIAAAADPGKIIDAPAEPEAKALPSARFDPDDN